jgi:deoxycytidylate deaminase
VISQNTLLKIALEEARKSEHQHRIGCCIFNKNTILSKGYNIALMNRKKLLPKFRRWPNSIHAEVNAILSAKTDLNGADIFIIRINKSEELLLARPCIHCMSYLEYVGIKKIIYSIKNGFEEESI